MNQTLVDVAERCFRPVPNMDKVRLLAEVRTALKARERALRNDQRQARLEKRVAVRSWV